MTNSKFDNTCKIVKWYFYIFIKIKGRKTFKNNMMK